MDNSPVGNDHDSVGVWVEVFGGTRNDGCVTSMSPVDTAPRFLPLLRTARATSEWICAHRLHSFLKGEIICCSSLLMGRFRKLL